MNTPVRTIRLDDRRWQRLTAAAAVGGWTASDLVRQLIDALPEQDDDE